MIYYLRGLFIALPLILTNITLASNITYQVNPVMLSDGYSIDSGFITTNGKMGFLSETDILDYQFVISGLHSYTFLASNPGRIFFSVKDLLATNTALNLEVHTNPEIFPTPTFRIEESHDSGQNFFQLIYKNKLFVGGESRVLYQQVNAIESFLALGDKKTTPQMIITIARAVPEPTSSALALSALVLTSCRFRVR